MRAVLLAMEAFADPRDGAVVSMLEFAAAMSAHGIGDEHTVIAYDDDGRSALALVAALRRYGYRAAHVLGGGRVAWIAGGGRLGPAIQRPTPASFTARVPLEGAS